MEKLRNLLFTIACGLFLASCGGGAQTESSSEEGDARTETVESHDAAREQFTSEDLKNSITEAGVVGDIQITYVDIKDVDEEDAKTYLLGLAHEVEDYNAWKPVCDADSDRRTDAGLKCEALTTDADNPNMVYLFFSTDDLDKGMEMVGSDKLKQKRQEGGVKEEPTLNVWVLPDTEHKFA